MSYMVSLPMLSRTGKEGDCHDGKNSLTDIPGVTPGDTQCDRQRRNRAIHRMVEHDAPAGEIVSLVVPFPPAPRSRNSPAAAKGHPERLARQTGHSHATRLQTQRRGSPCRGQCVDTSCVIKPCSLQSENAKYLRPNIARPEMRVNS
jgi:hypothetical protein